MDTVAKQTLVEVVTDLFSEAYQGARHGYTWFVDNRPDAGLFGTLAALSAEQASRPVVAGGSTVAAHAEHLRWSLALANAFARGEQPRIDWAESWSVRVVDDDAWERLQADLAREFRTLREAMPAYDGWGDARQLSALVGLVAHAAYHLGAVRQMVGVLGARVQR